MNSIALRKAISFLESGSCTARSSTGTSSATLLVERHQPLGDARLLGILDQRLAALLLLDLAGARQQRLEVADIR